MFLLGNFQHSLDDKNRIRLPSEFRKEMGDAYYLMPGSNGCIFVYRADETQAVLAKLLSLDSFDPAQALQLTQLTTFSKSVVADAQGRFMLPDELIKIMGIKKDVRIVGAATKAVIWSEERWQQLFGNMAAMTADNFNNIYQALDAALAKKS